MKRIALIATCLALAVPAGFRSLDAQPDGDAVAAAIRFGVEGIEFDQLYLVAESQLQHVPNAILDAAADRLGARVESRDRIVTCESPRSLRCTVPAGAAVAMLQAVSDEAEPIIRIIVFQNGPDGMLRGRFLEVRMARDASATHGWKVAEVIMTAVT